jgi:N-formylglutamate amidohydrolase
MLVIHIPHSSIVLPDAYKHAIVLNPDELRQELVRCTDLYCDEIFRPPSGAMIVAPVSRLACDVERFIDDDAEPGAKRGQGLVYSHTQLGRLLRTDSLKLRDIAIKDIYEPHHKNLTNLVDLYLDKYNYCLIIDGHSFSSDALGYEASKLPDICLGTDPFHTPDWLLESAISEFKKLNLSIRINFPYEGTIIPLKYLNKNKNVFSLMIEINKKIYVNERTAEKLEAFESLKSSISNILDQLTASALRNAPRGPGLPA